MALTAGALIGFLALVSSPQEDKTFQPAIAKFKQDFYKPGATDDDKIGAVNYLAQHRHEKIVKLLAPFLTESSLGVRIMVARSFAQFTDVESAPRELLTGLHAQANAGKKPFPVRVEILRSLSALRYKPAAPLIAKLVDDKEVWVAKAAIDASRNIPSAAAVLPLIRALHRIEGKEGDAEVGVYPLELIEGVDGSGLFKTDPREPKRPSQRELLKAPILEALQAITKQSFTAAKDWDHWWSRNKATFKLSD